MKIWRSEDGFLAGTITAHDGIIWTLAFSKEGKLLASGGADHLIKIWDVKTWKIKDTIAGQEDEVYCVAFSPAGIRLAGASRDMLLRIWDLPHGPNPELIRNAVIISIMAILAALAGSWRASIRRVNRLKVKNWKP
ncbi:MAG: hypothetical protein ABSA34_03515 [Candidatus Goldiibacteriota bacterium]